MKNLIRKAYCAALANPVYMRAVFAMFVAGLLLVSTTTPIIAADDFADMGSNIAEQSQGIAGAAQMLFYLMGFVLVGVSLIMMAVSRNRGTAVAMLVIGFVLTSIGFFISIGSSSFFGSDVSEVDSLFN